MSAHVSHDQWFQSEGPAGGCELNEDRLRDPCQWQPGVRSSFSLQVSGVQFEAKLAMEMGTDDRVLKQVSRVQQGYGDQVEGILLPNLDLDGGV